MPPVRASTALAVLLATAACSCGRKDSNDCGAVVAHYGKLVQAALETDRELADRAESHLPGLKDALLAKCREDKWSDAVRSCIIKADSISDLEDCDPTAPTLPATPTDAAEGAGD